jgi:5-formyltetrahydrofolate cyclo-ligase
MVPVSVRGAGYSDLEFALLTEAGLVGAETLVVTTVHPLQVIDTSIPVTDHDVNVDLVITPEEVIQCLRREGPEESSGITSMKEKSLRSPR